jgi:dienelactone hydrolase
MPNDDPLTDFEVSAATELGRSKQVYRIGKEGPCVLVCHELPGITPPVADFARYVASKGFQVSLPVFTGTPGRPQNGIELTKALVKVCISREFSLFVSGKSSPIVDWLRAFGLSELKRCGGPGIGVVGMCFSGGFALALAVDDHVLASVVSQPAVPARLPGRKFSPASIDVSDADLRRLRARLDADPELCVLAYRFSNDKAVPEERFAFLHERLGDRFIGVTIDSSPGNTGRHRADAHSVLTRHLVPQARNEVVALFERTLRPPG